MTDSNIADLLAGVQKMNYPHILQEKDESGDIVRWQCIYAEGKYAMLLRMPKFPFHYCGYVLIRPEIWNRIGDDELVRTANISYEGHGTRDICWKWFNSSRKLVTPGKVSASDSIDYWIGFDLQSRPKLSFELAMEELDTFITHIEMVIQHDNRAA